MKLPNAVMRPQEQTPPKKPDNPFHFNTSTSRLFPGDCSRISYYVIRLYLRHLPTHNMDPNYKARKEAFVSDLAGGSILEINAVTLVAPVCSSNE